MASSMSDREFLLASLIHELAVEVRKAMPKQEKKAKENKAFTRQDAKDNSYLSYSSSFTTT